MAFMCGCFWLCLYFLLRLNYDGVARISPFVEAAAYSIIFLITLGYTTFSFVIRNEKIAPTPTSGICVLFPMSDDLGGTIFLATIFTGIFFLGTLAMLLIVYKTFRDDIFECRLRRFVNFEKFLSIVTILFE